MRKKQRRGKKSGSSHDGDGGDDGDDGPFGKKFRVPKENQIIEDFNEDDHSYRDAGALDMKKSRRKPIKIDKSSGNIQLNEMSMNKSHSRMSNLSVDARLLSSHDKTRFYADDTISPLQLYPEEEIKSPAKPTIVVQSQGMLISDKNKSAGPASGTGTVDIVPRQVNGGTRNASPRDILINKDKKTEDCAGCQLRPEGKCILCQYEDEQRDKNGKAKDSKEAVFLISSEDELPEDGEKKYDPT